MAATAAARQLTEMHRLAQRRLGATAGARSLAAWRLLDPEDLAATTDRWLEVVVPIVMSGRRDSARLSATYLSAFRTAELGLSGGDRFTPALVEDLPFRQLATSLIVTGPVSIRAGLARGAPLAKVIDIAQARSAGAAMRHVINGGRESIVESVRSDRRALGWARSVSGNPCSFCAMLASRGPVFKGEDSAGFEAHDHCSCGAEPVYRRDAEWPAGGRRYQELWQQSTNGLSGDDARNAFRQALDA